MSSIEGYGGRAGNHQYAFEHSLDGIGSADVIKRIAKRKERERKEARECELEQE